MADRLKELPVSLNKEVREQHPAGSTKLLVRPQQRTSAAVARRPLQGRPRRDLAPIHRRWRAAAWPPERAHHAHRLQDALGVGGKVRDWALEVTGISMEQFQDAGGAGRQEFYKKFALYKVEG